MLFSQARTRQREAQRVLVRFLNEKNIAVAKVFEERRAESRTDVTVGVWIFPLHGNSPTVEDVLPAVTKDVSSNGLALVVHEPISCEELLLFLPTDAEPRLLRVKVHGSGSVGAGYYLLTTEVIELLTAHDYPDLLGLQLNQSVSAT